MKITRTFKVTVDGAEFEFEKPKGNEKFTSLEKKALIPFIFGKLKSVAGLQDEDGTEFTAEGLRSVELPDDYVAKIANAFVDEYLKLIGVAEVPAEKKSGAAA